VRAPGDEDSSSTEADYGAMEKTSSDEEEADTAAVAETPAAVALTPAPVARTPTVTQAPVVQSDGVVRKRLAQQLDSHDSTQQSTRGQDTRRDRKKVKLVARHGRMVRSSSLPSRKARRSDRSRSRGRRDVNRSEKRRKDRDGKDNRRTLTTAPARLYVEDFPIVRRPAIGTAASSTDPWDLLKTHTDVAVPPPPPPRPRVLPASVGQGNMMIATWAIGHECDPIALAEKLRFAPFDCIVMVTSSWVAGANAIFKFLMDLSEKNTSNTAVADVLHEKSVYRLGVSIFVALHRAKIQSCYYTSWSIRSQGANIVSEFGTLTLTFHNSRQRMLNINVGIACLRRRFYNDADVQALVEWLIKDKVAMLTGHFGCLPKVVEDIARGVGAIHTGPLFQGVKVWDASTWKWNYWVHPTYFLLFGYHRKMALVDPFTAVADHVHLGSDVWEDMVSIEELPDWKLNDEGSPFVPNLGNIKMKACDFDRWFSNSFQTCIWLGTATPSKSSQAASADHRSRGKGHKSKGSNKDKGNSKGAAKGKDKNKGKDVDKGKGEGKDKGKDKDEGKGEGKDKDKANRHR
jgi:hypothetical protein